MKNNDNKCMHFLKDEIQNRYAYTCELKKSVDADIKEKINKMSNREFEFYIANIFRKLGFVTEVTQETRDGGKDIVAATTYPVPYTLIVECKHWKKNKVDIDVVRSVYGVQVAMKATQSVIVTSSKFTKEARKFAKEQEKLIVLWDLDDILELSKTLIV